jgi:hypothetical protein
MLQAVRTDGVLDIPPTLVLSTCFVQGSTRASTPRSTTSTPTTRLICLTSPIRLRPSSVRSLAIPIPMATLTWPIWETSRLDLRSWEKCAGPTATSTVTRCRSSFGARTGRHVNSGAIAWPSSPRRFIFCTCSSFRISWTVISLMIRFVRLTSITSVPGRTPSSHPLAMRGCMRCRWTQPPSRLF